MFPVFSSLRLPTRILDLAAVGAVLLQLMTPRWCRPRNPRLSTIFCIRLLGLSIWDRKSLKLEM
jgi:hypothetical protein